MLFCIVRSEKCVSGKGQGKGKGQGQGKGKPRLSQGKQGNRHRKQISLGSFIRFEYKQKIQKFSIMHVL